MMDIMHNCNKYMDSVRLTMLSNVMNSFAACVFSHPSAGFVGVAINMIIHVTQTLNVQFVRDKQVKQDVVSIERIQQHNQVEAEASKKHHREILN